MIMNLRQRIRLNNFFFVGTLTMVAMYFVTRDWRFQIIGCVLLVCQGLMMVIAKREVKRLRKLVDEKTTRDRES